MLGLAEEGVPGDPGPHRRAPGAVRALGVRDARPPHRRRLRHPRPPPPVADRHGRALAEKVVRKHRLAERLLVDVIGLEWHKVHREAGRWEHVISDDVEARLVELLGDPATCPHGNPIPGSHSPAPAAKTRPAGRGGRGRAGAAAAHQRGGGAELRLAHPPRRGRVHPRRGAPGRRAVTARAAWR